MAKISFFVHSAIAKEVSEFLPEAAKQWAKNYTATEKNIFENLRWQNNFQYSVVMMPGDWAKMKWSLPAEAVLACIQGSLRLVFWRAEVAPAWSVPMTVIPKGLSPEMARLSLQHLCRAPTWGLASCMPAGTKIYTERSRAVEQLNEKIEQIIEWTKALESNPGPTPEVLKTTLQSLVEGVWAESELKTDWRPVVFQMAFHKDILACAIRWTGVEADFKLWRKSASKWSSSFKGAQMALVQICGDTRENEILLILGAPPVEVPVVIDVISTTRLRIAAELEDPNKEFLFEFFEKYKRVSGMEDELGSV